MGEEMEQIRSDICVIGKLQWPAFSSMNCRDMRKRLYDFLAAGSRAGVVVQATAGVGTGTSPTVLKPRINSFFLFSAVKKEFRRTNWR